jgi:hypothetical protein
MSDFVAFSGGKDSTAVALRLAEMGHDFDLLYTPTGTELPAVRRHIDAVVAYTGRELVIPDGPTLLGLINEQQCLPNHRMRWCTRMIKIEPCAEWLRAQDSPRLAIGLRADEEGRIGGTYEGAEPWYPLREWDWGLSEVVSYVAEKGFTPPKRTDCAWCYAQTLGEWWSLWRNEPALWSQGEALERSIGHTFRSDSRDTWPASMRGLRERFECGDVPKPRARRVRCRVCAM